MKLTKILLSAALLISTAHLSDAQAMLSFSDAKKAATAKYQQAKKAVGKAAHSVTHSKAGKALSSAGSAVRKKASGFGHLIAKKTTSARSSIQSGANNIKNRLTNKGKKSKTKI